MILINAKKSASVSRVLWGFSGLSWGPHGLKMCDSRSLEMGDMHAEGWVKL